MNKGFGYHHKCKCCNLPDGGTEKINNWLKDNSRPNGEPNFKEVHRLAQRESLGLSYDNIRNHGRFHFNPKLAVKNASIKRSRATLNKAKAEKWTDQKLLNKLVEVGGSVMEDKDQLKRISPRDKINFAVDAVKEKNKVKIKSRGMDIAHNFLTALMAGDKKAISDNRNIIDAEYEEAEPKQITG